jgi:hypothetical protein
MLVKPTTSVFSSATLAFSHRYGVLGGTSTKGSFPKPYRDNLSNFREEASRAWTILKMYEAALNRDWMAAKSLIIADEIYEAGNWSFEDSPDTYLQFALQRAALEVAQTVEKLCRPTLRFAESSWPPRSTPTVLRGRGGSTTSWALPSCKCSGF